jgi:hypothetical protein
VLALAGFGGLDVGVDCARDGQVSPSCFVLIDDRGAFAVVPHPGHQIFQARAAGCRKVVPGVPEIVKVQAFGTDRPDGVRPSRYLVEVAAAQRAALDPREDERVGRWADEEGSPRVYRGMSSLPANSSSLCRQMLLSTGETTPPYEQRWVMRSVLASPLVGVVVTTGHCA